jgi:hypothetical protein
MIVPPATTSRDRQKARVEATTCFQQAIKVARRQKAELLELRVAMSLARFWQQ